MSKKTICVDFDGVLHAYTSGWQGVDVIPDGPVPGAMGWLSGAVEYYDVCVYSARSSSEEGRQAMQSALCEWFGACGYPEGLTQDIVSKIRFPTTKPPAWVTIDDRVMRFDGVFPSYDSIDGFKPWYQRGDDEGRNGSRNVDNLTRPSSNENYRRRLDDYADWARDHTEDGLQERSAFVRTDCGSMCAVVMFAEGAHCVDAMAYAELRARVADVFAKWARTGNA